MNNLYFAQTTNTDEATLLAVGIFVYLIIFLIFIIPGIIVIWKLYVKAGEAGWKAIIPMYNTIVMAKIAKKPVWTGVLAGLFALSQILISLTGVRGIFGLTQLIGFVFALYILNSFIKQYDRGIGTWFLYIFIPLIGVFIVDKANFKGISTVPLQEASSTNVPVQQSAQPTVSTPEVVSTPPVQTTQPSEPPQQNNQ